MRCPHWVQLPRLLLKRPSVKKMVFFTYTKREDMNYRKIYADIIRRAKERPKPDCYTERHHIVPKSLGGSNEKSNIAILTAREHFLCHWLLVKMYAPTNMSNSRAKIRKADISESQLTFSSCENFVENISCRRTLIIQFLRWGHFVWCQ